MYTVYIQLIGFLHNYGNCNSVAEIQDMIEEIISVYGACTNFKGFKIVKNY